MFRSRVSWALVCSLAVVLALSVGASNASADIINFEQFAGPPVFSGAGPNQTLLVPTVSSGIVTVTGGLILTNADAVLADLTSIYGTAYFAENQPPPPLGAIVLAFQQPINNFFLNLYNGHVIDDTFTVSDNAGNSTTVTLPPTGQAGTTLVSFPAAGSVVTITTANPFWDFFVDDVGFNQPTPGTTPPTTSVPEPDTLTLLASSGLIGAVILVRRRRQQATSH